LGIYFWHSSNAPKPTADRPPEHQKRAGESVLQAGLGLARNTSPTGSIVKSENLVRETFPDRTPTLI
jgi:hypothetical protein